ncbi:MAG: efflux RND transporter periplasmic adaptor subunit [Desulfobacterales bacterium]|nr:efflux RND transporter periplasmic adaptor subunit [Desulfobacterales bacterium]
MTDKTKTAIKDREALGATEEPSLFFKERPRPRKRFKAALVVSIIAMAWAFWPKGGIEGVAVLKAERIAQLGLTSSGILEAIFFKEGDSVSNGDLLARFRNPDLEKEYAGKKVALDILTHEVTRLQKKKEFLVKEKQRKTLLFENGAIGLVELELTDLDLGQTVEEIAMKEKKRTSQEEELTFLKSRVESLELKAPFSGVLLNDPRQRIGNFLRGGDFILELVDPSSFYLELPVNEKEVDRLSIGNRVGARFHAFPTKTISGKISRLGPKTEEEVEKVFKIRHVIPVEIHLDEIPTAAKYGMRAWVRIKAQKSGIGKAEKIIPDQPIETNQKKPVIEVPLIGK